MLNQQVQLMQGNRPLVTAVHIKIFCAGVHWQYNKSPKHALPRDERRN